MHTHMNGHTHAPTHHARTHEQAHMGTHACICTHTDKPPHNELCKETTASLGSNLKARNTLLFHYYSAPPVPNTLSPLYTIEGKVAPSVHRHHRGLLTSKAEIEGDWG